MTMGAFKPFKESLETHILFGAHILFSVLLLFNAEKIIISSKFRYISMHIFNLIHSRKNEKKLYWHFAECLRRAHIFHDERLKWHTERLIEKEKDTPSK